MELASTEGIHKMPGRRGGSQEPSWFDQALAAFQEALELVDREKDPGLYGMVLHEIADVHTAAGDLQAAATSYRDAAKYKRRSATRATWRQRWSPSAPALSTRTS